MRKRQSLRRAASFYLVVAMLLSVLQMAGVGVDLVKAAAMSGSCGDNVKWNLTSIANNMYKLTISGSGPMNDYNTFSERVPWEESKSYIEEVVIGSGVTRVGDYSFAECAFLDSVSLPTTITEIGDNAFYQCKYLTEITLPPELVSIGGYAFDLSGLKKFTLPNTVTTIGTYAFYNTDISDVVIPKSVTSIGNAAFGLNFGLKTISVEAGNKNYKAVENVLYELKDNTPNRLMGYAYGAYNSSVTLQVQEGVTRIDSRALSYCRSSKVILPESLIMVEGGAFSSAGISELNIPDSVQYMGQYAFSSCSSLKKISVGKGLQAFAGAIYKCKNVEEITIDTDNPYMICEDGVVYSKDKTCLEFYIPKFSETIYEMPDTVVQIATGAICLTANLERLILSPNLEFKAKHFRADGSVYVGDSRGAISYNSNLLGIYFKGNAPSVGSNKMTYFLTDNNEKIIVYYPEGGEGYDSASWSGFTMAQWRPENAGDSAEGSLENISWEFEGRTGILKLCGTGTECTGDFVDDQTPWFKKKDKILEVEVDGIAELGAGIFTDSSELLRIITDENLISLGASALENCPKLLYADVATAKQLGSAAFKGARSLNDGIYFQRLETAGANAFSGCSAMTTITLGNKLQEISEGMFQGCESLVMTMVPESVKKICANAYQSCSSLRTINIPEAVESIEERAFADDTGLEKIYFYGGIPEMTEEAFSGNKSTLTFCYRVGNKEWEEEGSTYLGYRVKALRTFFTEKRDHYSFANTADSFGYKKGYKISKYQYLKLLSITKSIYYDGLNKEWRGSCMGMTGTALEFYENKDNFDVSRYDAKAENLYDLSKPGSADSPLTDLIELYQISQFAPQIAGYKGETAHHLNDYSGLIQKIEEFERSGGLSEDSKAEPVIMEIFSLFGGHAVVPVAVDPKEDGTFDVTIYDPNYPDSFRHLIINKDLKGIRYGIYFAASYLSYEVLRDTLKDPDATKKMEDDSLYLSVNKDKGTIKDNEGNSLSNINGAYEQHALTGNDGSSDSSGSEQSEGVDVSTSYRSYVVPEGDYVIGKEEALGGESEAGTDDAATEDEEPISFLVASDDMYASIEVSNPEAVLEVKDIHAGDGEFAFAIQTEEGEAVSSDITLVNDEGIQRELSVEGGGAEVTVSADDEIKIESTEESEITVISGNRELDLNEGSGSAILTMKASADENPYIVNSFTTDLTCDEENKLQGSIAVELMKNNDSEVEADVHVDFTDGQNRKVAEYDTEQAVVLKSGMNLFTCEIKDLVYDIGENSGEQVLHSKLTITDKNGKSISCEAADQTVVVTLIEDEPTVTTVPTIKPTTQPTAKPTVKPTTKPTEEPTVKPTTQPTAKPTVKPTTKPTEEATAKPTIKPTEEATAKPTTKPTEEPIVKPTIKPTEEITAKPTIEPTVKPTPELTVKPTTQPSTQPTVKPTVPPTNEKLGITVEEKMQEKTEDVQSGEEMTAEGEKTESSELQSGDTFVLRDGMIVNVGKLKYIVIDCTSRRVAVYGAKKKNVKKIVIPKRIKIKGISCAVDGIWKKAFFKMNKLSTVTIGENVTFIGEKAFWRCKKLDRMLIKTKKLTKKKLGNKAFQGIYKKGIIYVPKSKKKSYKKWLRKKGWKVIVI